MKTLTLIILLLSCSTATHRDPASQLDNSVFHEYLDSITDKDSTPSDKAFFFMQLLRETDGLNSGEEITTIKGPPLPSGFTLDQLIERFSSQKNLIKLTRPQKIKRNLVSWASGAKSPRVFKDEKLTTLFANLFLKIEQSFSDINLNRLNLFHAHLVGDDRVWGGDIFLIFHAFEYPIDLELKKNRIAVNRDISLATFRTGTRSFDRRNLIWSLRANKIWRVDTSKGSIFNHLIRSPAYDIYPTEVSRANTAQESYFGKVVGDINYFPQEYKEPFITRGVGNPPVGNF